jgi:hypothetical protein
MKNRTVEPRETSVRPEKPRLNRGQTSSRTSVEPFQKPKSQTFFHFTRTYAQPGTRDIVYGCPIHDMDLQSHMCTLNSPDRRSWVQEQSHMGTLNELPQMLAAGLSVLKISERRLM